MVINDAWRELNPSFFSFFLPSVCDDDGTGDGGGAGGGGALHRAVSY